MVLEEPGEAEDSMEEAVDFTMDHLEEEDLAAET